MADLFPEILQFNISFIFVLLIIAVSAGLGYLLYQKTNPQNSFLVRAVLAVLRTVLLLLIIILFFNPAIFYRFIEQKPKKIALLIDHSASMALKNESESRADSTGNVVSLIKEVFASKDVDISIFYFNQTVFTANDDTLSKPFGLTNFNNLDNFIAENTFDQVILVSDGIRTDGAMPQINGEVRIYTIGVGNNLDEPDISILNVEYKPSVYQGKEQEVIVRLANKNISNGHVRVSLFNNKNLIREETIEITESGVERELTLSFKPQKVGLQQFSVEVFPDVPDVNSKNNRFVFTQEVVKNKILVGIFSAAPNYEHKFLKFILRQSEMIDVHSYITIKNKKISRIPFDSLDVIIFQDFPAINTLGNSLEQIKKSLTLNKQGFIVFPGKKTNLPKLNSFNEFLPVSNILVRRRVLTEIFTPSDRNYLHPIISLFDDSEQNAGFWNSLPPVQIRFAASVKKESIVLLKVVTRGEKENGLVILENKGHKSALINGIGLWNWHFSLRDDEDYKDGYKNFILNLVHWSANKTKFKPVVLKTNKNTIHPGQEIIFEGFIYSAQNEPLKTGRMEIEVIGQHQNFTIQMESDGSGSYKVRYAPGGEGRFDFVARAYVGDKEIGRAKQTVEVIPYNREFIQTDLDSLFLKRLAENSGGKFFKAKDAKDVFNYLDFSYDNIRIENEIQLRYKTWLLYFLIGIAVLEWVVRKKNNLV